MNKKPSIEQLLQQMEETPQGRQWAEQIRAYMTVTATDERLKAEDWLPHIFHDPDFKKCIEACDKILIVKGNDYTQGKATGGNRKDRLTNFYECSDFFGLTSFQSLGVYWYKHLTAIFRFLAVGRVESEPIEGRIHDCINYLLLLFKMIGVEKDAAAQAKAERTATGG